MPIHAEVTLTERDLLLGALAMPEQRFARWTPLVVLTIVMAAFAEEPSLLIMGILLVPFLLVVRSLTVRLLVRRQYRAMPEAGRHITFEFREDGLSIGTTLGKASLKYEGLHRFAFFRETLLIYTSPRVAQVVPCRAFGKTELTQIRSWLEAKVPPLPKRMHPAIKVVALWLALILFFLALWQLLAPDAGVRPNASSEPRGAARDEG